MIFQELLLKHDVNDGDDGDNSGDDDNNDNEMMMLMFDPPPRPNCSMFPLSSMMVMIMIID